MPPDITLDRGEVRFLWVGPVSDPSGHADELRGFLRAQELAGDAPALHELPWTDTAVKLSDADRRMLRRQAERRQRQPDIVVHTYLPRPGQYSLAGGINVQRAMFETDRLPVSWLAPLLERDEVWVPCRQNFDAFADSGIPASKLRIIGGTLDFDLFQPGAEPYALPLDEDRFVFLTNFDFSARKAWEILLRAWHQAFNVDDPVCLVLKTGSFYRPDGFVEDRIADFINREFGNPAALAPVHILTNLLSAHDMPRLYAAADAYVLASRGEGWGRPFMEARRWDFPPSPAGGVASSSSWMRRRAGWWMGNSSPCPSTPRSSTICTEAIGGSSRTPTIWPPSSARSRAIWTAARARAAAARPRLIARFGAEAIAGKLREAGLVAMERLRNGNRLSCVIRGEFGSAASLAAVNDGLVFRPRERRGDGPPSRHRPAICGDAGTRHLSLLAARLQSRSATAPPL